MGVDVLIMVGGGKLDNKLLSWILWLKFHE